MHICQLPRKPFRDVPDHRPAADTANMYHNADRVLVVPVIRFPL